MLGKNVSLGTDACGTGDDRMHITTTGLRSEHLRRRHRFKRNLSQLAAAHFREYQYVGHRQSTFASVWRRRTSSGTAAALSPRIRPAARSAGSDIFATVT